MPLIPPYQLWPLVLQMLYKSGDCHFFREVVNESSGLLFLYVYHRTVNPNVCEGSLNRVNRDFFGAYPQQHVSRSFDMDKGSIPRACYIDGIWNQEEPEKWFSIIQFLIE